MNVKTTRKTSAQRGASLVGSGTLVRRDRVTLPPGWEKCRTGIKGVRKWRNMASRCWVTERADDTETLHCGIYGVYVKVCRMKNSTQHAVDSIHAMTLPNDPVSNGPESGPNRQQNDRKS